MVPDYLPERTDPVAAELVAKAAGFPLEEDNYRLDPEYAVFVTHAGRTGVVRRGFTNEGDAEAMVSLPGEWAGQLCNDHRDAPAGECSACPVE
ncbi:hypothetical protein [Streptomyces werraensis]|uniref:hypothetical protein n=1 Tax=Streptomyces werraensis TaxID=68284 RepID=UPI00341846DA